nr:Glu/Leu/Phe/Val dehydrogenase dimerization domain-containing protein [Iodidimonas gelatinilytica]
MPVFSTRAFNKHEQVVFCSDPLTGLRAIIAVHSTVLGPAVGGCRFWDYAAAHRNASLDVADVRAEEDAIFDVLRLSRGMSYKNAMAGLRLGGGKSVIIGDPKTIKTPELLQSFGNYIQRLGGSYYTAEDVGTKPQDMETIHGTTDYVVGLESGEFATGDPSPHTAKGVFTGIQAAVRHKLGRTDLDGLTVAIQASAMWAAMWPTICAPPGPKSSSPISCRKISSVFWRPVKPKWLQATRSTPWMPTYLPLVRWVVC